MLNKETIVKIAIALLVIAIVWFILKARKKHVKKHRKTIVTAMPIVEKYDDMGDDGGDDDTEEQDDTEEGFASWNADDDDVQEDYAEMSPVEFRSELLE